MRRACHAVAEARQQAAALLRRGWTQRGYAFDAAGRSVSATSPDAIRWCLYGALHAVGADRPVFEAACDQIRAELGLTSRDSLDLWNDRPGRTQAEVVAAMAGRG